MTALIIIFISLSLMGSALWVLPPKKERLKMALRMKARQLGLTVQLTSIDLPDKWDKTTSAQNVCAYRLYRAKAVDSLPANTWLLPYDVWKYVEICEGWWCSNAMSVPQAVTDILMEYEKYLRGVEITPEGVSFYWHERGDEAMLETLSELLYKLEKIHSIAG
ncbi:hypothetical protein [Marinomonas sp.]